MLMNNMSVSFIYQNMTFYYRIDSHSSSMPFIAWGCRQLPISGTNIASKEAMMEDIKDKLKQYYRNRKPKADAESVANNRVPVKTCDVCDKSLQGMENEGTRCIDHDFE